MTFRKFILLLTVGLSTWWLARWLADGEPIGMLLVEGFFRWPLLTLVLSFIGLWGLSKLQSRREGAGPQEDEW